MASFKKYAIQGIDVSHYQSTVNWERVKRQNVHFAFVKATEGATLADSLFCYNWNELNENTLKRGAYHFFRPTVSAEAQFNNFSNWVELQIGDLPPVLDVEVLDDVSKIQLITGVRTWLFLTEIHYNVKPILYTNLKFYNRYLAGQFDDYPIWIARYGVREPITACGREWQFWQYGNTGKIDGINGAVDVNVFYGSHEDLQSLCVQPKQVLSIQ